MKPKLDKKILDEIKKQEYNLYTFMDGHYGVVCGAENNLPKGFGISIDGVNIKTTLGAIYIDASQAENLKKFVAENGLKVRGLQKEIDKLQAEIDALKGMIQ